MNKKIIYLSVFLILALFLISSCKPVGERTGEGIINEGNTGPGIDAIQKIYSFSCTGDDGFRTIGTCATAGEKGTQSCNRVVDLCFKQKKYKITFDKEY